MGLIFETNGGIFMSLGQYLVHVVSRTYVDSMGKQHEDQWEDECLLSFQ